MNKVNIQEVCEETFEYIRKSVNGEKIVIKWNTSDTYSFVPSLENPIGATLPESASQEMTLIKPQDPEFIKELFTAEGPYTHEEILEILSTPEWTVDISVI